MSRIHVGNLIQKSRTEQIKLDPTSLIQIHANFLKNDFPSNIVFTE